MKILVADYVLFSYGNGAIMAIPGHDKRNYDFASKYSIAITQVIDDKSGDNQSLYVGNKVLINSGEFDRIQSEETKEKIVS
jgi:leucyl-tRNA synthetase